MNLVFHKDTKYIDIDRDIVREKLQNDLFHLFSIKAIEQPVDVFTKALNETIFNSAILKLGMTYFHSITWGKAIGVLYRRHSELHNKNILDLSAKEVHFHLRLYKSIYQAIFLRQFFIPEYIRSFLYCSSSLRT